LERASLQYFYELNFLQSLLQNKSEADRKVFSNNISSACRGYLISRKIFQNKKPKKLGFLF